MQITIKGRVAKALESDLADIQEIVTKSEDDEGRRRYRQRESYEDLTLDLTKLTRPECERLRDVLASSGLPGTKVLVADINKYLKAEAEGIDQVSARTVRQFAWMLERFIADLPHHLLFSDDEYEGGSFVAYYIDDVAFDPGNEKGGHERYRPPSVAMRMLHIENDSSSASTVTFHAEDCIGMGAEEALREAGYVKENPKLLAKLKEETERYYEVREMVGTKFLAKGLAVQDLDDATTTGSRGYWSRSGKVRMDDFDVPTPCVVDVLFETDTKRSERESDAPVNLYRWHKWNLRYFAPQEDDLARFLEADEDTDEAPEVQVPVHPLVPCFDLRKHRRVRVHVNNLTEYEYKTDIRGGLVLPERDIRMLDMLVDQSRNVFEDVVEGKGSSINILLGGPPGTGKTLSTEVLAEYKKRALYSVQCSQLGLDPESVEKNLVIILQRANRWNAVLLLDEADVYIRKRGLDLQQNAIVGVFLRVLEYASCILVMTTNLPEEVDDAIASRCIIRIDYDVPTPDAQFLIWKSLAGRNKLTIADEDIRAFIKEHPRVSGRDVKNLLKLASFISATEKRPLDASVLKDALDYKPTADVAEAST